MYNDDEPHGRIWFFSEGGGLKFDKLFCCKRVEGPKPEKFLIFEGFLMQSNAYCELFLNQYIAKS